MSQKEAYLKKVEYWKDSIDDYRKKIAYYDKKLEKAEDSDIKLECYLGLKEVCEQRIKECQKNIKRLLTGGYGEIDYSDDGSEVAKWQRQAHPEIKSLPFSEWKKKYGDRFTKTND